MFVYSVFEELTEQSIIIIMIIIIIIGACNPNLQVVICHASRVCSQHSFWTSTKNEQNVQNAVRSCAFRPFITLILIMGVLTICHMKLTQSSAMASTLTFDCCRLHSSNLQLLLVIMVLIQWNPYWYFIFIKYTRFYQSYMYDLNQGVGSH